MSPDETPPWRGGAPDEDEDGFDPALEFTRPLPPHPPAPPGAPTTPPPSDPLLALARHTRAGAVEMARRYRARTTEHGDAWMLDAHRAKGAVDAFKTERDRLAVELAARKRATWAALLVLYVLLTVLFFVLHAGESWHALAYLFAVAGAHAAVLARLGHGAARQTAAETAPPGAPPEAGAPAPLRLDVDTLTGALQDAGFLKDGRAIEVRGTRPMTNGNGWSCWVTLPGNLSAVDVIAKRHDVANSLNTNDPCLILLPSKERNRDLFVWLCDYDPLGGPPVASGVAGARQVDVWKGVPLGRSVQGDPILASVVGTHWLLAGDTGSGKSFLARLLVSFLAKDPHVQLIFMDPDDAGMWEPFGAIGEYYGGSSDQAVRAMADRLHEIAYGEMERRAEVIRRYRKANPMQINESKITRAMARDPKWRIPVLFIVIDECHVILGDPRVQDALQQIATRGRKFGIGVKLMTQYPSTENIPAKVRNVPTTRCALSLTTSDAARMVLKDGYKTLGMDPVGGLDPEINAGAFYLLGPGLMAPKVPWVLGKADYLDDNEARTVLTEALELRRRIRPDILPSTGGPGPPPGTPPAGELPPPPKIVKGDARFLLHVATVFSPDPELRTLTVVERLKRDHPAQYGKLTQRGMNSWLKPFGLRTEDIEIDGRSYAGLRFATVYRRLLELAPGLARELPGMSGTRDPADFAATSETGSGQGFSGNSRTLRIIRPDGQGHY